MAAITAFKEPGLVSRPAAFSFSNLDFSSFEARRMRYAIFWAFYENNAYRNIHHWATAYKAQYSLYRYIRNVYNPAYRLSEFWKSHLLGGRLDPEAGEAGAVPIAGATPQLRQAIAQLWRSSVWQVKKDVLTLYGPTLGDVGIRVVDDPLRNQVYLQVIHPGVIENIDLDPFGNTKAYSLTEEVPDPRGGLHPVTYREEVTRDEDEIIFTTYLNNQPYNWNGVASSWSEPYGFAPFALINHNDVNLNWGWAEMHPGRPKFHELDDLASKLHDYIRKSVDSFWLFSGIKKPEAGQEPNLRGDLATVNKPEPGRDEVPALYGPEGSRAQAIVANLDISHVLKAIAELLSEIERDYPELNLVRLNATGQLTGRSMRLARVPAEDKVLQRRPAYDDALVRAMQMAIAIGGFRGYPGYESFSLDSYRTGNLDFSIAERPVFRDEEFDDD